MAWQQAEAVIFLQESLPDFVPSTCLYPKPPRLGVYLHGCAGDTAAFNKGFHSMTASDVLDAIPELLKEITLD